MTKKEQLKIATKLMKIGTPIGEVLIGYDREQYKCVGFTGRPGSILAFSKDALIVGEGHDGRGSSDINITGLPCGFWVLRASENDYGVPKSNKILIKTNSRAKQIAGLRALCHTKSCTNIYACPNTHPECKRLLNTRTALAWEIANCFERRYAGGYDIHILAAIAKHHDEDIVNLMATATQWSSDLLNTLKPIPRIGTSK